MLTFTRRLIVHTDDIRMTYAFCTNDIRILYGLIPSSKELTDEYQRTVSGSHVRKWSKTRALGAIFCKFVRIFTRC